MYCVVSKEALDLMKGNRGKLGAQIGHAFLHAYWNAEKVTPDLATQYRESQSAYKIVLMVPTIEEVIHLSKLYEDDCGVSLITDAGFTVFDEPTTTCVGIGPIDPNEREEILKNAKILI
tara:strand:- start:616 stop:972 length:357 start_codon:yes stop_codon:yes gene_type:complete